VDPWRPRLPKHAGPTGQAECGSRLRLDEGETAYALWALAGPGLAEVAAATVTHHVSLQWASGGEVSFVEVDGIPIKTERLALSKTKCVHRRIVDGSTDTRS
jgi:hypothetical protein